MASMEPRRTVEKSSTADDDATAAAPLIVNGLTIRPREKVNLWHCGILFLPDFAVLFVAAGLGMRRWQRWRRKTRLRQ